MARIRSVHPKLFTDEAFVSLSDAAQIFFIGLWTEADDFGAFEWKPLSLKMRIRPASEQPVEPLLAELVQAQRVVRYEHEGRQLGLIRNFTRYQRPKSPKSTYFIPPQFRKFTGSADDNGENEEDEASLFPPNGEIAPQREEEGGRRLEGEEEIQGGEERVSARPRPRKASRLSEDWRPSVHDIRAAYDDGISEDEARREFEKFKDYWRSRAGNGGVKLDWSATYRNWMRRAADDKRARAGRVQGGQVAAARH